MTVMIINCLRLLNESNDLKEQQSCYFCYNCKRLQRQALVQAKEHGGMRTPKRCWEEEQHGMLSIKPYH